MTLGFGDQKKEGTVAEQALRTESDSMGNMQVPAEALYGAQTARAVENFPISGYRLPPAFLRALGLVKLCCARANREMGVLEGKKADAIEQAAAEIAEGGLLEQFPIDVFQTGSGTSTNMNANEVIANRAIAILGGELGNRSLVHPNNDVNYGQSSNDVIPTTLHVAVLRMLREDLEPALLALRTALEGKAKQFAHLVTVGRTHMMDATPILRGQAFSGYASQIAHAMQRLDQVAEGLAELALGGTAVGTGLNRRKDFPGKAIAQIAKATNLPFREAPDRFEALGAKDACVFASGMLRSLAVALSRIAHDIRQLGSGPRCGIGELILPAVAPGSSIMPGKVNPVMSEALIQISAWVIGNDVACGMCGVGGIGSNYELNTMMPLFAHNLLESIRVLSAGIQAFTDKCVVGIEADVERAHELVERSLMNVTKLAPVLGYDESARIAKEAYKSKRSLKEVVLAEGLLPADELDALLDPSTMVGPSE